jgi:hypothetical protein
MLMKEVHGNLATALTVGRVGYDRYVENLAILDFNQCKDVAMTEMSGSG